MSKTLSKNTESKQKKFIDESYVWRYPTIVDRSPGFLAYLRTKPEYVEALLQRRQLLRLLAAEVRSAAYTRVEIDLFDLKPARHLSLV